MVENLWDMEAIGEVKINGGGFCSGKQVDGAFESALSGRDFSTSFLSGTVGFNNPRNISLSLELGLMWAYIVVGLKHHHCNIKSLTKFN